MRVIEGLSWPLQEAFSPVQGGKNGLDELVNFGNEGLRLDLARKIGPDELFDPLLKTLILLTELPLRFLEMVEVGRSNQLLSSSRLSRLVGLQGLPDHGSDRSDLFERVFACLHLNS